MIGLRSFQRTARTPAFRQLGARRWQSMGVGEKGLEGAADNAFNRERAAVKDHAAASSGMSHTLPCIPGMKCGWELEGQAMGRGRMQLVEEEGGRGGRRRCSDAIHHRCDMGTYLGPRANTLALQQTLGVKVPSSTHDPYINMPCPPVSQPHQPTDTIGLRSIVIPCLIIAAVNAWRLWGEHWEHAAHEPIEDRVEYPYMNIRTKNYFWGDGDKTLFWNPTVNIHQKDE
ncbi:hypothetical protein LTR36_010296 [Oleoguttula mirabilis]|uniref:Cytochrome c oxidase subunit n=1 Tax=Oleoguttula mirabilis TaxID=1507867 RepID=A0AAV9J4F9_9PEZI|nr:hypothetical protein LTR36_010296 [Oleoguttula mirabilis]